MTQRNTVIIKVTVKVIVKLKLNHIKPIKLWKEYCYYKTEICHFLHIYCVYHEYMLLDFSNYNTKKTYFQFSYNACNQKILNIK